MTYKNLNAVILEVYRPKSPDEQKFVDKHVTIKHKDRNGNEDDVFKGNTKYIKRKEERHGYDVGEDEKVYESIEELDEDAEENLDDLLDEALDLLNSIDEKTLTPAELKKREEIVKAVKRGDPKMDKSMAYAIATKTAKRVAEESEEIDENYERLQQISRQMSRLKKKHDAIEGIHPEKKRLSIKLSALKKEHNNLFNSQFHEEAEDDGWYAHKEMHGKVSKEDWKKGWRYNKLRAKVPFYHEPTKTYHAKIKVVEDTQIDELSRDTLSSYAGKASDARGHRKLTTKKVDNRYTGVARAQDRLTKEETLDELSKKTLRSYRATATKNLDYHDTAWDNIAKHGEMSFTKSQAAGFKKHDQEAGKRIAGIKMATRKLNREGFPLGEVEEANTGDEAEKKFNKYNAKELDYMLDRAAFKSKPGDAHKQNRARQAKDAAYNIMIRKKYPKLTKEDIIDSAYERYIPEEVKFTPQKLFVNRLENLSESHADILMSLFESLSKENQTKMSQDAKTTEGLNKLLNFAIENRENV